MATERQNLRVPRNQPELGSSGTSSRQVAQWVQKDVSAPFGDKGSQPEWWLSQETAQDAESVHRKRFSQGSVDFQPRAAVIIEAVPA